MTWTYRMLEFETTHRSVGYLLIVRVGGLGLVHMHLDI